MNGAESLVRTLIDAGVDTCFVNPGTSEMHFVAALDRIEGIHCVLGLFEGVVTGAADGYARMSGKPGVTLLHLGPGLANGIANLHNARKSGSSIVNIVGEHALWHIEHDAPLTSDIEGLARPVSHWVRTARTAGSVAQDGAEAMAAAQGAPGRIATLILPANTAWEPAQQPAVMQMPEAPAQVPTSTIDALCDTLATSGPTTAIILGGNCLTEAALDEASRIARHTGASLLCETFKTRMQRGAGRVSVEEIPYAVDAALAVLAPFEHIVTAGARAPVAFFAYPDKPSALWPEAATVQCLSAPEQEGDKALQELAEALGAASVTPDHQTLQLPPRPADGPLDPESLAELIARELPENAIVIDESITAGRSCFSGTAAAAKHDWLEICGGSIGGGFPLATGAAVACPDRKVVCLEGDGSAMYTVQALWTQARESLDVVTVVLANRSYAILKHELNNVQAEYGQKAVEMMELEKPALDWVAIAAGMGVNAVKAGSVSEFEAALKHGFAARGPFLIEAVL